MLFVTIPLSEEVGMSILLILAAFIQSPTEPQTCEHVDERKVSSLVKRASDTWYSSESFRPLAELANYWRATCSNDRFRASKRTVKELSGLLHNQLTRQLVSQMLLSVGPSLSAARSDVDAAIVDQTWREDALMKASAPITPEAGIGVADLLRCVRHKMDTGNLDSKFCLGPYAVLK